MHRLFIAKEKLSIIAVSLLIIMVVLLFILLDYNLVMNNKTELQSSDMRTVSFPIARNAVLQLDQVSATLR